MILKPEPEEITEEEKEPETGSVKFDWSTGE